MTTIKIETWQRKISWSFLRLLSSFQALLTTPYHSANTSQLYLSSYRYGTTYSESVRGNCRAVMYLKCFLKQVQVLTHVPGRLVISQKDISTQDFYHWAEFRVILRFPAKRETKPLILWLTLPDLQLSTDAPLFSDASSRKSRALERVHPKLETCFSPVTLDCYHRIAVGHSDSCKQLRPSKSATKPMESFHSY